MTLNGQGTAITTPLLIVGGARIGRLTVQNGAELDSDTVQVANASSGSDSTTTPSVITVDGNNTYWKMNSLSLPMNANHPGVVYIQNGALAQIKNQLSLSTGGTLHLTGGTLRVDAPFTKPSGVLDFSSGTLILHFDVVAQPTGPLGPTINLGTGKYLVAKSLRLPSGGQLNLQGGRMDTGNLINEGGAFSDTAASTTSVSALSGFNTLHLLGAMRVGDYSTGDVNVGDSRGASGAGYVQTLTVDKSLAVNNGYLSLWGDGQATVGDVLSLGSGSTLKMWYGNLTTKSLDASAVAGDQMHLDAGTLVIDGGTFKGPSSYMDLGSSSNMNLTLKNGATTQFTGGFYVGATGKGTVSQDSGVTNVAGTLRLGNVKDPSKNIDADGTYNLSGTGQLNANGGYEVIGYQGKGTFNLNGGTNRAAKYLYLGETSTGRGTYNVNSGTLSVADGLYVGGNAGAAGGTGTLTINNGTVTVGGTLKLWPGGTLNLNGGVLTVGALDAQSGTINYNGGKLRFSKEVRIGTGGNFGTTVTLDGAQRSIEATAGVSVIANGALTARNGGTVNASGSYCNVGKGGTGTLNVPDGGTVLDGNAFIGPDAADNGTVTVSGTGKWTNSGELQVGALGQGTLTIQSGGTVSDAMGRLACEPGSQGTVTVDGGTWTNSNVLGVGRYGTATMTIQNGGKVTNTDTFIGFFAGANGTLTVTGSGTTYSPGNIYLAGKESAAGGTGTLIVDNAAQVTVPGTLKVWAGGTLVLSGSDSSKLTTRSLGVEGGVLDLRKGTFTVNGGTFTASSDLTVQGGDTCPFYVTSGTQGNLSGRLTVGDATIGRFHQSSSSMALGGTLTVAGAGGATGRYNLGGSSTLSGTTAVVGAVGSGTFSHSGGTASFSGNLYLGNAAVGARGQYTMNEVDGPASSLSVGAAVVGNQGRGVFEHEKGTAEIRGDLFVGYTSSSQGSYYYFNPASGSATVRGQTYVGYAGYGALYCYRGIMTHLGTVRIGNNQGAEGYCKITAPSELRNDGGYQVVGYRGKGTIEQTGGLNRVSRYLFLAEGATANGTYKMTGGTATVGTDLCVGGNTTTAGGTGTLAVSNGEVHIAGTLRIWGGGTVTITGGKVYVDTVDNTHGGTFNLNGGELHVREFRGNLTNNGGTVCPGSSPGTTTILGDYLQGPGGTLQIELSNISDLLAVSGQMSLGGNLQVLPYDGFNPLTGFNVDCLNWQNLAGKFEGLSLPALPGGANWDLTALYTTGQLSVVNLLEPFPVSGTVRNAALAGLPGVTVTAKVGLVPAGTTTTDANGNYTLMLPIGSYTVTPTKLGSTFQPSSQPVTVAGTVGGVDFAVTGAPATYSVSGTLRDANGYALAGVEVTAAGKVGVTGSGGTYRLSGLVAGEYTVTPTRAGYVFTPASVVRTLGANVTGLDFTAAVGSYTLSGTVRDGGGAPLAGAAIIAGGQTATTAEDGTYALTGLFPGPSAILPVLSGYTFAPALLPVTIAGDQAGVNFTATANPYTVSGTVLDGAGAPLAGVTVVVGDRAAVTQVNGSYTVDRLAAGTYLVAPFGEELAFAPAGRETAVGPSQGGVAFVGGTATYAISGKVTAGVAPVAGVTVTAGGATATTDATGAYALTGLTAGSYDVTSSKAGYVFEPGSAPVVVGPDRTAVDFAATPAPYAVSGVIRDGAGAAMAGVAVTLGDRTTTTDATGAYGFQNLVAGAYTVTPSAAERTFTPASREATVGPSQSALDFQGAVTTYTVSGVITDGTDPLSGVTVSAGGHSAVTGVDGTYVLTLEAGEYGLTPSLATFAFTPEARTAIVGPDQTGANFVGTLDVYTVSGVVTDGNAQPLPGAEVSGGGKAVTADAGGAYALAGLAAGTYDVRVQLAGFTFATASQPVTVGPDQARISFTGTEITYTIGGTVRDAADRPLAGVAVTLGETTVTTGEDGAYTFAGLLAGTYAVTPALEEVTFTPASRTIAVGPDAAAMNFVGAVTTYSISGTILNDAGQPLAGIQVSGGGQTATTAGDGSYTVSGLPAGTVLLTPSAALTLFQPHRQPVAVGPNQVGVGFVGWADDDGDGTANAIENGAPNGGDGNADGIQDARQACVVSLPNGEGAQYVTLIAAPSHTFWNTRTNPGPEPGGAPMALALPAGMVSFELRNVTPGGAATVTLVFHTVPASPAHYGFGPTPYDPTFHWYAFSNDGTTGAEMQGSTVILHLVDGRRGDRDLAANGAISGFGGPGAVLAPVITDATPAAAAVGGTVTLTGANLTGASAVRFAGTAATFTVLDDATISAVVPSGATAGPIAVVTPGGTAVSSGNFAPLYPVSAVKLTIAPWITLPQGAPITLTASPVQGIAVEYEFWARRTTESTYSRLQAWGPAAACTTWLPSVGAHRVFVKAREQGQTRYVQSPIAAVTVTAPLTGVALSGSPTSSTAVDASISFLASATGGANVEYRFTAQRDGEGTPSFVRDYILGRRSTIWAPSAPGTYTVTVTAREQGTTTTATASRTHVINPKLSSLLLERTAPTTVPVAVGVPLGFLATASGGGTLEYQFLWNYSATTKLAATWTKETYGNGRGYTFKPTQAGFYTFRVYARGKGSTANFQVSSADLKVEVKAAVSAYTVTFTPSGGGKVGGPITIAATGIVGGAQPQWKFWAKQKGTSTWLLVRDYAAAPTVTDWKPATAGTYDVMVYCRELGSKAPTYDKCVTATYVVK